MSENKSELLSSSLTCTELYTDLHVQFIQALDEQTDNLEYWYAEHLKLSGVYWGLTSLALLNRLDALDKTEVVKFVVSCYHPTIGGFGGHPGHDPHLLYTLSALQILAIYDFLDTLPSPLDRALITQYIVQLQGPDGAFRGDEWGETDTRFTYAALNALALLNSVTNIDMAGAARSLLTTQNPDGGFGAHQGSESHAGQIFTCVSGLAILGVLDTIETTRDQLCWWLCERQLPCGGLNGRPMKLEDVCYSWWVLSALKVLGRAEWIDLKKLKGFIISCQDSEKGGFSDRPDHVGDVFHTLFGLAGLSLLGDDRLQSVDPVFCLPTSTIERLNLSWAANHYQK